jgi:hypothetical protein
MLLSACDDDAVPPEVEAWIHAMTRALNATYEDAMTRRDATLQQLAEILFGDDR